MQPADKRQDAFLNHVHNYEMAKGFPALEGNPKEVELSLNGRTVKILNYISKLEASIGYWTSGNTTLCFEHDKQLSVEFDLNTNLLSRLDCIVLTRAELTKTSEKTVLIVRAYFQDGPVCYASRLTAEWRVPQVRLSVRDSRFEVEAVQTFGVESLDPQPYNRDNLIKAAGSFRSFPEDKYHYRIEEPLRSSRISEEHTIELINFCSRELEAHIILNPEGKLFLNIIDRNNPGIKPFEIDRHFMPHVKGVVIASLTETKLENGNKIRKIQAFISSGEICFPVMLKTTISQENEYFHTNSVNGRLTIPPKLAEPQNTVHIFEKDLIENNVRFFRTDNSDVLLLILPSKENGLSNPQVYRRNLQGRWDKELVHILSDNKDPNLISFSGGKIDLTSLTLKLDYLQEALRLQQIPLASFNETFLQNLGVKKIQLSRKLDHLNFPDFKLFSLGKMDENSMYLFMGDKGPMYRRGMDGYWRELNQVGRGGMSIVGSCSYYFNDESTLNYSLSKSTYVVGGKTYDICPVEDQLREKVLTMSTIPCTQLPSIAPTERPAAFLTFPPGTR